MQGACSKCSTNITLCRSTGRRLIEKITNPEQMVGLSNVSDNFLKGELAYQGLV